MLEWKNEKPVSNPLETFMNVGCITCHNGATLGGNSFQKLGAVEAFLTDDPGRFNVTRKESDRGVFKVPSLRNVAETGPYFHDGGVPDLETAVRLMGEHQLGRTLDDGEVGLIIAFLESLTGEVDAAYIAPPDLPESGPETPAPDPS